LWFSASSPGLRPPMPPFDLFPNPEAQPIGPVARVLFAVRHSPPGKEQFLVEKSPVRLGQFPPRERTLPAENEGPLHPAPLFGSRDREKRTAPLQAECWTLNSHARQVPRNGMSTLLIGPFPANPTNAAKRRVEGLPVGVCRSSSGQSWANSRAPHGRMVRGLFRNAPLFPGPRWKSSPVRQP